MPLFSKKPSKTKSQNQQDEDSSAGLSLRKSHNLPSSTLGRLLLTFFSWAIGLSISGVLALAMIACIALAIAYPQLPDISDLADYRPKLSMRVYSLEGKVIGEFGEERRTLTAFKDIPQVMKNAVLAIEDARFYQHGGVDYVGLLRASIANLGHAKSQGASTITMQVARNVYLSSEKTFTRKIYEILLTLKLEHMLSKDQIFEIYLNQIFLGNRAYGFAAASQAYFGKPIQQITIAEAAMLAGLPKAPSAYNPISNPKRARTRQQYIIERMLENGFITKEQAQAAKEEELHIRSGIVASQTHAEYVAEMVRQLMYTQYGPDIYTRGLNVYTTIKADDQEVAYQALRRGIMDYELRQIYRGPERFINLPTDPGELADAIDDALVDQGDKGDLLSAVVLDASPKMIRAMRLNSEMIEITGDGLKPVQSGLSEKAPPNIKLRAGALIRIIKDPVKNTWSVTQLPEVEGAFVAIDPRDGAIRSLVGGFDFDKNKFNHVTQAWRQPGSGFKPFIYSAALEKGFTPTTIINDAPLFFTASETGGQAWEPKNFEGTFEGPMALKTGLAKSKNMISIRILNAIGTQYAQKWITRFGFEAEKHPPYLTMALGAGSVTPMQLAVGYSVFANGGYLMNPYLITKVVDPMGKVLTEYTPAEQEDSARVIDQRNAFLMTTLLNEVTRVGTAAKAQAVLKRVDLYGKTGTTNDSLDAWFSGFQPTLTAITWIGYDTPKKLGDHETGGGLSLPIWIRYMQQALKGVPVTEIAPPPSGVVREGSDWYFSEFAHGNGVTSLGLDNNSSLPGESAAAAEERKKVLDIFKN
jgi:penicillin-binding protein 1A